MVYRARFRYFRLNRERALLHSSVSIGTNVKKPFSLKLSVITLADEDQVLGNNLDLPSLTSI